MAQHNMKQKCPIKICRNEYVYNMSQNQLRISNYIRPLFKTNKKHDSQDCHLISPFPNRNYSPCHLAHYFE
jgi:hypothetical protein